MSGEDKLLVLTGKNGDAARILSDFPEMAVVKPQQSADNHFIHHAVPDD